MNIDKKIAVIVTIIGLGMYLMDALDAEFNTLLLFLLAIMIIVIITNTIRIRKLEEIVDNLKNKL